jgi:tripartite-type tricarboxylate transporter receptor subunit TctC
MNFKKTLASLMLLLTSAAAMADKTIGVIWPYGPGDPPANYARFAIDEMNKIQTQYNFIFDNRPGAGSAVASKHVEANPNTTVLSTSTAFFIRPNFFPNESHNVSNFAPLVMQCANPMVVVSKKYKNLDLDKNTAFTIGTSGLGDTTYLLAMQIKEKFPNAVVVPYKSTSDALVDVIGGNIDFSVGFVAAVDQYMIKGDITGVGVSGKKIIKNIPTLASKGIPYADDIVIMFFTAVNKDMPAAMRKEMREIVSKSTKAPAVHEAYRVNFCDPIEMNEKQMQEWFDRQQVLWAKLTKTVKLDK